MIKKIKQQVFLKLLLKHFYILIMTMVLFSNQFLLNNFKANICSANVPTTYASTSNYLKLGEVVLRVFESGSNNTINAVNYNLYRCNERGSARLVGKYKTKNGMLTAKMLLKGQYYFKEAKTPDNYEVDTLKHTFIISEKLLKVEKTIVKLKKNSDTSEKKGLLQVERVDPKMDNLYYLYKIISPSRNVLVGIYEFDNNNFQVNNLEQGQYYFLEASKESGLFLGTEAIEFSFDASMEVMHIIMENSAHDMSNISGRVVLTNFDSLFPVRTLTGGTYKLYRYANEKENEREYIGEYSTKYGQIILDNLQQGNYYIVNTNTLVGYTEGTQERNFSVPAWQIDNIDSDEDKLEQEDENNESEQLEDENNLRHRPGHGNNGNKPEQGENEDEQNNKPGQGENEDEQNNKPGQGENEDEQNNKPGQGENEDEQNNKPGQGENEDEQNNKPGQGENEDEQNNKPGQEENEDEQNNEPEHGGNEGDLINNETTILNYMLNSIPQTRKVKFILENFAGQQPAVFSLYEINEDNSVYFHSNVNLENGNIIIDQLQFGNYFLRPEGSGEDDRITFTVEEGKGTVNIPDLKDKGNAETGNDTNLENGTNNGGNNNNSNNNANSNEVNNENLTDQGNSNYATNNLKLIIRDKNNLAILLPEASFLLYKNDGTLLGEYTTGSAGVNQGIIFIKNLVAGSYYFLEKSPPTGYVRVNNNNKIAFTINALLNREVQVLVDYVLKNPGKQVKITQSISMSNDKQVTKLDLPNFETKFNWHIIVDFGNQISERENLQIVKDFSNIFNINTDEISIVDRSGRDVKSKGTVSFTSNKFIFALKKDGASKYKFLENEIYTITIPTTFNTAIESSDLINRLNNHNGSRQYVDLIANNELFAQSVNTVHLRPPFVTETEGQETPKISKSANYKAEITNNWGNNIYLERYWQKYYWHVQIFFGKDTSSFYNVKVEASIPEYSEVVMEEIAAVDKAGNNVSPRMSIQNSDNKLSFILNKEADTFSYLNDETYFLTIPLKFSKNVTKEMLLAKYNANNKNTNTLNIPSIVTLEINDYAQVYNSEEINVVTPPLDLLTIKNNNYSLPIPRTG